MAITRVTQNMMMERSLGSLQSGLSRLAKTQEQLSTGRVLNRPSDSPTDTTSAMRLRSSLTDQAQFKRNAEDGLGWLGQADSTLTSSLDQVRRARNLALEGANATNTGPTAREALAAEVDQLRESLIQSANTTYLGRPIFGGNSAGDTAYTFDAVDPGVPVTFTGQAGQVKRTVSDGVEVQVNVNGPDVFGPAGATLFEDLAALSTALRSGDANGIRAGITALDTGMQRITNTLAEVGTKTNRIETSLSKIEDATLSMTSSLTAIENVDLPRAMIDLQMNEVAYQAALAGTARVMQPSLLDFLR